MEIPFIINGERLHATGDRVLGEFLELSVPRRVNRPIDFESASNPIEKLLLAFLDGRFSSVMQAGETNTLFHESIELLEVLVLKRRMAAAAIAINHDRISAIEGRRIL